jgi:hypothetical protein
MNKKNYAREISGGGFAKPPHFNPPLAGLVAGLNFVLTVERYLLFTCTAYIGSETHVLYLAHTK